MAQRGRLVVSLVLYQASWFACVLGAANGVPWVGIAVTALAVATAILLSGSPRTVLALALGGVIVGGLVETAMLASGLVDYAAPGPVPPIPPLWMLALWVGFAINTNELLGWLSGRPLLHAALGGLGAPLAYLAGEALGAMTFVEPRTSGLLLLAALWAVAFPALMRFAKLFLPR